MEKLSGILPSSPRVRSVDLEEAPAARPGAPRFGKKQGRNTASDQVTVSSRARALAEQDRKMVGKDPKEIARGKMVDELTRQFFETRLIKSKPQSEEISDSVSTEEPKGSLSNSSYREQIIKNYSQDPLSEQTASLSTEA